MKMIHLSSLMIALLILPLRNIQAQSVLSISDSQFDELFLDFSWDHWLNPPSNITLEDHKNRGITLGSVIDLGSDDTKFSFAPGVSISNSNIFSDVVTWEITDEGEVASIYKEKFYRKNKISLTYLEFPLELRFRLKPTNKTFKFYLGAKGGFLIDAHTKIKNDNGEIDKHKTTENFYPYRYGAYMRLGYNHYHLFAYYGLSPVFDDADAPDTNMFSLGLSLSGL